MADSQNRVAKELEENRQAFEKCITEERKLYRVYKENLFLTRGNGAKAKTTKEMKLLAEQKGGIYFDEKGVRAYIADEEDSDSGKACISIDLCYLLDGQSLFTIFDVNSFADSSFKKIKDSLIENIIKQIIKNREQDEITIKIRGFCLGGALAQYLTEALMQRIVDEPDGDNLLKKINKIDVFVKSAPKISAKVVENAEKLSWRNTCPNIDVHYQEAVRYGDESFAGVPVEKDKILEFGESRLFAAKKNDGGDYGFDKSKVKSHKVQIKCAINDYANNKSKWDSKFFDALPGNLHGFKNSHFDNGCANGLSFSVKREYTSSDRGDLNVPVTKRGFFKKIGFKILKPIIGTAKAINKLHVGIKRKRRQEPQKPIVKSAPSIEAEGEIKDSQLEEQSLSEKSDLERAKKLELQGNKAKQGYKSSLNFACGDRGCKSKEYDTPDKSVSPKQK